MTTTTFTKFRRNAKAYFDAVETGETVQVLRHGHVIAEIVPPAVARKRPSWKKPGLKLIIPGVVLSRAILAERKKSAA
jgi:antitoxin (DNA-binding transcriptional repressor) of toxin-antitoxin stability system